MGWRLYRKEKPYQLNCVVVIDLLKNLIKSGLCPLKKWSHKSRGLCAILLSPSTLMSAA